MKIYYKIGSEITEDFGAYAMMPMYDEHPDIASYEQERPSPGVGDYIVTNSAGTEAHIIFIRVDEYIFDEPTKYEVFATPAQTQEFIARNRGSLLEVSEDEFNKDTELQSLLKEIQELHFSIQQRKDYIEELSEELRGRPLFYRIFFGIRKEIKELNKMRRIMDDDEACLNALQADYDKIKGIK